MRRRPCRSCSGRRRRGGVDADLVLFYAGVRHLYAAAKCLFGVVKMGKGRRKKIVYFFSAKKGLVVQKKSPCLIFVFLLPLLLLLHLCRELNQQHGRRRRQPQAAYNVWACARDGLVFFASFRGTCSWWFL